MNMRASVNNGLSYFECVLFPCSDKIGWWLVRQMESEEVGLIPRTCVVIVSAMCDAYLNFQQSFYQKMTQCGRYGFVVAKN